MYITALFADERGVGALISFNNENYYTSITNREHENEIYTSGDQKTDVNGIKEENCIEISKDVSNRVDEMIIGKDSSIFLKYTAHLKDIREGEGIKQPVPHITLVTNTKRFDICRYLYVNICKCIYTYTYINPCIFIFMLSYYIRCIYIYIYIYIYICKYICLIFLIECVLLSSLVYSLFSIRLKFSLRN
jgi:hypothetical protein